MENNATDNPLKLEKPIIYVEGNLIIDTDKIPFIHISSACNVKRAPKDAYIVNSDLTINNENAIQYSTFTLFLAKGEIVFYCQNKVSKYESSEKEFEEIMATVDEHTPQLILNLLYASIFSRFEMYMQQLAWQWIQFHTEEIVKLFANVDSKKYQRIPYDGMKGIKVIECIKKATLSNEPSRNLLHILFGNEVRIPQEIQEGYEIRNDIMHRDGFRMNGEKVLLPIDKVRSTEKALLCFLDQIDQANGRKNARLLQAWKEESL